ncbi:MAG: 3-hydroxyacyl-CoA dehydrogenase family protein, partial [Thermoleophilaceae bacterium]|nr:3-hydroxyacyl-CoA dehydrogenase family protein [Thermoleophilaceae bacterium]
MATMSERLGIAGSGAIACGLARTAAAARDASEVLLWARSDASAERAEAAVDGAARVVTDLGGLRDRTIVVEAIAEEQQAKGELLRAVHEVLDEQALLGTTTSSLSVTALGEASGRPERFAGLHVFNPVEKMKLVELVFHGDVADETHQRMHDICHGLGKEPVEVPDTAGFVVNRLLFPFLFEAVRMLERTGIEPKAIDTCMKLGAGHPMGP